MATNKPSVANCQLFEQIGSAERLYQKNSCYVIREHNVSCLHYYVKISDTPNLDGYGVFHHDPMDPSHRPDDKDLQEIKDKWIAWE